MINKQFDSCYSKFLAASMAAEAIIGLAIEQDPWCHNQGLRDICGKKDPADVLKWCRRHHIKVPQNVMQVDEENKYYYPLKWAIDAVVFQMEKLGYYPWFE